MPIAVPLTLEELLEMDGEPVWVDDIVFRMDRSCGGLWAIVALACDEVVFGDRDPLPLKAVVGFAYRCDPEKNMPVPADRLKELAEADAHGMVVVSKIPIGTTVYQLHQGSKDEVRIIDGEEYTRKVPNWYITHHKYSWVDAIADAERPERRDKPNCRYYFTLEEARAERDRINAGGDPNA